MKPLTLITASLLALTLAACGNAEKSASLETASNEATKDMTGAGTAGGHHDMDAMGGGVGHGKGVIRSVGNQGDFLTIEHGPIDGIGMGAMTMGFDIVSGVDLSGFAEGDEVAFMVKQGRDGSFRIVEICNTSTEGDDCIDRIKIP